MKTTYEGVYRVLEVSKQSIWACRQGVCPGDTETVEIFGDYSESFKTGDLISYKILVEVERVTNE